MTPLEKLVLEAVKLLPGTSRRELPDLVPDFSPGSVRFAAYSLTKRGHLKVTETPSPTGGRPCVAYSVNTDPAPKPLPVVANDNAELEELRAFKKMVLEQHPELAIPPIIRRAREIVMRHVDPVIGKQVGAGQKDECPIMLAVIDALEEGIAA